jgi:hypothetical protein
LGPNRPIPRYVCHSLRKNGGFKRFLGVPPDLHAI